MKTELQIHTWPDKILQKKCKEIPLVDKKIGKLLDRMVILMREKQGVGLAGNQVGLDLRLVVIETKEGILKLVNPCITKSEGRINLMEGCLSFPGIELKVKRAKKIFVSALNEAGRAVEYKTEGLLSAIFQHEVDHLNGISFIDRVALWDRWKIKPLLKKIRRSK